MSRSSRFANLRQFSRRKAYTDLANGALPPADLQRVLDSVEARLAQEGARRVLRGGSWGINAVHCRSAVRFNLAPVIRNLYIGFRVVLDSP